VDSSPVDHTNDESFVGSDRTGTEWPEDDLSDENGSESGSLSTSPCTTKSNNDDEDENYIPDLTNDSGIRYYLITHPHLHAFWYNTLMYFDVDVL
jgi:hypothetical protein